MKEKNLGEFYDFEEDKNLALTLIALILLLFSLFVFKMQFLKLKSITTSDPNLNYQDTYCRPSLKKVQILGFLLFSIIFGLTITIFIGLYSQFLKISDKIIEVTVWLQYSVVLQIRLFVIFNQLVEYFAIFYIIFSQKNRNINEILFDFNHEPIYQKISIDQVSYRRIELRWVKFFKYIEILLIITSIAFYGIIGYGLVEQYQDQDDKIETYIIDYPLEYIYLFSIFLTSLCFLFLCILIYNLYKFHRLEFKRLRANLFFEILFFLFFIILSILQKIPIQWIKNSKLIFNYLMIALHFNSNVLIYYIIFGQSSKDVLQGVSKLDYSLKVSFFQVYKDKKLELKKSEFFSIYDQNLSNQLMSEKIRNTDSAYLNKMVIENIQTEQKEQDSQNSSSSVCSVIYY